MNIQSLQQKNIHVVGATSAEGSAIIDFLIGSGCQHLTAHDFCQAKELHRRYRYTHLQETAAQINAKIRSWKKHLILHYADTYLTDIEQADLIFVSQAWFKYTPNFPKLPAMRERGIPFQTITQLYFDLFPGQIIGITGTNGKSTTTALIAHILDFDAKQTGRFRVLHSGNERHVSQVLDQIQTCQKNDVLVLEISNRQLIELTKAPHLAVITNITPDHLDDHASFEEYIQIKQKMFRLQQPQDVAIINVDHPLTKAIITHCQTEKVVTYSRFSSTADVFLEEDRFVWQHQGEKITLGSRAMLPLAGDHNVENGLAAILTAMMMNVAPELIGEALPSFKGLPYRLEFVAKIDEVYYYNDVKSTTPAATIAALNALSNPIILIAGGGEKGDLDYSELAGTISEKVKSLILLAGEGADVLTKAIFTLDKPVDLYYQNSLQDAIIQARELACAGDAILLSPACPYFSTSYGISSAGGYTQIVQELRGEGYV